MVNTNIRTARAQVRQRNQRFASDIGGGDDFGGLKVAPAKLRQLNAEVRRHKDQRAARLAPALTILNQLSRPVHGVAAGTRAAIHGRNVPHAVVRGVELKDKSLFSDVLNDLGIHGSAANILGFGLDVALDPTTYVSFGQGSLLRKGLEAAAEKSGAKTAGEAARGTLPIRLARHVNPNIRPAGVSKEDFETVRHALRRGRAISSVGEHHARNIAQALAHHLPGHAHPNITDALESGSTEGLTKHEAIAVGVLKHEYDRIHATEHGKGLVGPKLSEFGYAPRRHISELERGGSKKRLSGAQLVSSKARTNRQMYRDFRGTKHDIYTENAPLAYYLRARDSAVKQGRHEIITALHKVGRVWHPGSELKAGEEVYKFAPRKMPIKVEGDELKSLMHGGAPPGRNEYRILHGDLVGVAESAVPQRLEGLNELGRLWDRGVQGRVKTILTVPNPQYHLTNLYGDLFNAYLGSPVTKLARNLGVSAQALVYKARREAASKTLGKVIDPHSKGIVINGERKGLDELVKEAEAHGAIGQGFIGRDLAEVLDAQGKEAAEKLGQGKVTKHLGEAGRLAATSSVGSKLLHPIDAIRDLSQYREDWVRLATYLGARKRGLEPDEAAAFVSKHHFDYGDLTQFERSVLRRVLPFYTFTARNTPLQIRTLFEHPGKYANLEKVREEALKASGVPDDYEQNLQYYEQQGIPIPIPGTKNLLYPKLPATDLGRLTIKDQSNYLMAMLSPVIKSPIELTQNYSFFLRKPIDELVNAKGPHGETVETLKPAPPIVVAAIKHSPGGGAIAKALHMRQYTDQKTGKKVIGWPARLDYVFRQTPATNLASTAASQIPNTRGQSSGQAIFGYLTGLKNVPYSPPDVKKQNAGDEYNYLEAKAKKMRHDGDAYDSEGNRTPAYQHVLDQARKAFAVLDIQRKKKRPSYLSPEAQSTLNGFKSSEATNPTLSPEAQEILRSFRDR